MQAEDSPASTNGPIGHLTSYSYRQTYRPRKCPCHMHMHLRASANAASGVPPVGGAMEMPARK